MMETPAANKPRAPRKKYPFLRWTRRIILLCLLLYALAAVVPYAFPPEVGPLPEDWLDAASSDEYVDSAAILETGQEALETRLRLIRQAREKNATDVLGSWTGVPWDEWEEPVQDADDL